MRYVTLRETRPGMRLAYDLYDSFGRTLVGSSCELTDVYIEKLREYGVGGVYITDRLSEDIEVENIISPELRREGLACIRVCDIDGCHDIAKRMVSEILGKCVVSLDMADLRTYDDYTYAHSVNVAVICCVIGVGMELPEEDLLGLVTAALLHDLGKLSIPPEILNKPGRLTPEEYQVMKSHATVSYELLKERWDVSAQVKSAVLFHHENVDGSGYPQGLEGHEQTLFTKILHVADVYDALVSKRPYKNPYSPYEASEYLMGGCGIMFDQTVVDILLRYVPLYPKGTAVILSDGRTGIIYENAGVHNLRPIIRLFDGTLLDMTEKQNLSLTLSTGRQNEMIPTEDAEESRKEMLREWKRYRIMAVDDMKTNLQMIRGILDSLYDVTLIKSGSQALH